MMNNLYAILLILHFINGNNYVTAAYDYAVNRQGLDHGVEMHHSYSKVTKNQRGTFNDDYQEPPFTVASAREINQLAEPNIADSLIHENMLDIDIEPVGTECPSQATGTYPYLGDCKKFLYCYKGEASIRICPQETLFNPQTKFCDNPSKVKCVTLSSVNDNENDQPNQKVVQFNDYQNRPIMHSGIASTNENGGDIPIDSFPEVSEPIAKATIYRTGRTKPKNELNSETFLNSNTRPVCPTGAQGLLPHPTDCAKFINCNGMQSIVQNCGPGTEFNPDMQICDWPQNVNCAGRTGYFEQYREPEIPEVVDASSISTSGNQNARFTDSRAGRQERGDYYTPKCPDGAYGLVPHPYNCAKFMNCHGGRTFIQDCGPGTHFNPQTQVCDWPQNVNCESQDGSFDNYQKSEPVEPDYPSSWDDPMYSGSGRIDVRFEGTNTQRQPKQQAAKLPSKSDDTIYSGIGRIDVRAMRPPTEPSPVYQQKITPTYTYNNQDPNMRRPFAFQTTTPLPRLSSRSDFHEPFNHPVYVHPAESTIDRPHETPIYNRDRNSKVPRKQIFTSSTSTTTTTPYPSVVTQKNTIMSTDNYNRQYYNPKINNRHDDEPEVELPSEAEVLSEALKMLLKPYMKGSEPKVEVPVETKIRTETLDNTQVGYEVSDEQMSLAGGPDFIDQFDVEERRPVYNPNVYTTSSTTTSTPRPMKPWQPGFVHSPEYHSQHRPAHGPHHNHNQQSIPTNHDPEWHKQHGVPMQHNYNHNHNHNLHHNHNQHHHHHHYQTTATTPDLPPPIDPRLQPEEPSTTPIVHFSRDPKQIIPVTKPTPVYIPEEQCDGFKCKNNNCVDNAQLCNGKNDCGDRSDEENCSHLGYEVRLSNDNGKKHEGRVEVKVYGVWGYVCDDKFDMTAANVLCKELGFKMGASELRLSSYYAPSEAMTDGDDAVFIMDEVKCYGNETTLKQCDFNGWGVHDCNADEVVGVVCKIPIMSCPPDYWLCEISQECIPTQFICDNVYDCADHSDESPKQCNASLEMRLVEGKNKYEGRVEVKYRGVWGTICDDDFGSEEANVICRQLGFDGESTVVKGTFGQGKGPIWLDQVKCLGNETTIDDCVHWQWGEHNCAHTEDVGVKCHDGTQRIARTRISSAKGKPQTKFEDFPYAEKSRKTLPDECGVVKVNPIPEPYHERVVRGTQTPRGTIPWQASIRAKKHGKSVHWCGAVLISRYHLITAAHCLVGYPKGAYLVRLGDHRSDETEPSEIEVYVENLYIHEDFRKGQHMNNDIAIILLKSPIRFNDYIQPVCLPTKTTYYKPGMNCTISGWGAVQSGSTMTSLDLRAGKVPIQSDDICKQPAIYGEAITPGMFCAGSLDKAVDACDGDSGGPLVCESNGVNTLYGIISWGQHCGFINKPGVYVKIAHYIDWIQEKLEHSLHHFGV